MPAMKIRFPGGRYHATPWGHHVNEGLIEWPPCPWRLLRALIATGYTKLDWDEAVPQPGQRLIEALAQTLPKYDLPPASGAHSRHYMPLGTLDKGREKTTLVFDTWANVAGEVVVHWDCSLDGEALALFDQLVSHLGYLGRSESWVEAEPVGDMDMANRRFNAYPHEKGHNPGPGWEQVSLIAADQPSEYADWRKEAVKCALADYPLPEGKKKPGKKCLKNREKAVHPYPADLLDCLQRDTAWWKAHHWSQPPGSRRVIYWRRADALQVSPPTQSSRTQAKPVTAMLLALNTPSGNKSALPSVSRTLPQAELLHRALVGRAGNGHKIDCPELTGKDEHGDPLRGSHQHAHILPLDLDNDQHIDHILIYASMGLRDVAQRAIRELKRAWTKGGVGDLQLALAGQGELNDLRHLPAPLHQQIERLLGPLNPLVGATRWRSITPFVPPRYEKRKGNRNDLIGQINKELRSRGLPDAQVQRLRWDEDEIRPLRHYIRRRQHGGPPPPQDVGYALELQFAQPVQGPLALGYGCHFGLGLFVAPQEESSA